MYFVPEGRKAIHSSKRLALKLALMGFNPGEPAASRQARRLCFYGLGDVPEVRELEAISTTEAVRGAERKVA